MFSDKIEIMLKGYNFALLKSILMVFVLSSCERDIRYRGNVIEKRDVIELKKKKLTKSSIIEKFGFPTISLSDNEWIYIAQKVEYKAFLKPVILFTKVVRIVFTPNGDYKIAYFEPKYFPLSPSSDKTKIKEENLSFIEQLKKNVLNMGKR